ncbi:MULTISPECIES: hypothetical protein [unclassified Colwellia]|uniref:hypothetical protein n=1 Tax=unclassified Colwellia TaxID=196834 RepID=UPI0015F5248C|nr:MULTISPECIES: hypothetical protein [unclassified Colwellia]MBA6233512.1 hypothetical protein [Colwellia sp. MB02u-7]MBA6238072.1 hypothetical protein [Colwellia sp. MB02u-11]MBA6257301.1 hypothetical protein [Colwellia sp. MB3u-28]MBA6258885.1 hypothetical protein [Colwellia sp. MB3u-41]MBA6299791.1 hypothetical protein [Colwellia sp. MB3u-22]
MKNIIYTILFLVCTSTFGSANAASGVSTGKITTIHWYEGHTGVLVKQIGMSDLGGCGRADYYILDDTHSYFNEIYSLILSAHISSQSLSLSIDGCIQGISRIKHITSSK